MNNTTSPPNTGASNERASFGEAPAAFASAVTTQEHIRDTPSTIFGSRLGTKCRWRGLEWERGVVTSSVQPTSQFASGSKSVAQSG